MYLFSRSRLHDGKKAQETVAALLAASEAITEATEIPVFVWQQSFHPMGNGFMSSCRVDSRAELDHAWDKMLASSKAVAAMDRVAELAQSPPLDHLAQVVAGSLGPRPANYINVSTGTARPGRLRESMAWGTEMTQLASSGLDVPVVATVGVYGVYGSLSLIASYETIEHMDEARAKMMVDATINDHIAAGAEYFEAGPQFMLRRLN